MLLLRLCGTLAIGGDTALWGCEMGILGKWSFATGTTGTLFGFCSFYFYFDSSSPSFQLFLFLLGEGLVNLDFLSALSRF